jgi:phospholipase/carboxylesterase
LLILLHGVGSSEADLFPLAGRLDPRLATVSARAPHQRFPGSYVWFEVQVIGGEFVIQPEMEAHSRELLAQFIPEAVTAYGADPRRVYLGGFSQGAIMSLSLMLTRPDLLAGVAAMSGRLLPEVHPLVRPAGELEGFPVLVVHGMYDPVIPLPYAEEIRDFLSRLPVGLEFEVLPMGHEISAQSLERVRGWLSARLDGPA